MPIKLTPLATSAAEACAPGEEFDDAPSGRDSAAYAVIVAAAASVPVTLTVNEFAIDQGRALVGAVVALDGTGIAVAEAPCAPAPPPPHSAKLGSRS